MKIKLLVTIFAIVISSLLTIEAQTAKKKTTQARLPQAAMNDLRCWQLHGKVKSSTITYQSDDGPRYTTLKFNAKGQMTNAANNWVKTIYTYYTDKKYKKGDVVVLISYGKNKRVDMDDYGERFTTTYEFNANGQLIEKSDNHDFMNDNTKYYYKSKDSKLPYKKVNSGGDASGSWNATYTYKYLAIDVHGNWTKREVTCVSAYEEYNVSSSKNTETYTETQKLIYY